MRRVLWMICYWGTVLTIVLCFASQHAEAQFDAAFLHVKGRVAVQVSVGHYVNRIAADELAGRMKGYLERSLRKIPEVNIVQELPDYRIVANLLDLGSLLDTPISSYALSYQVEKPVKQWCSTICETCEESDARKTVKEILGSISPRYMSSASGHWVVRGDGLEKASRELVEMFESDFIEREREEVRFFKKGLDRIQELNPKENK